MTKLIFLFLVETKKEFTDKIKVNEEIEIDKKYFNLWLKTMIGQRIEITTEHVTEDVSKKWLPC